MKLDYFSHRSLASGILIKPVAMFGLYHTRPGAPVSKIDAFGARLNCWVLELSRAFFTHLVLG